MDKNILYGKKCPYCFNKSELVRSTEVYQNDYGWMYLCRSCEAYVGCHNDTTKAKGRLANKDLRALKIEAHRYFDALWRRKQIKANISKTKSRKLAYKWLSQQMNIEPKYTHIGMFNEEQCKKVIELCKPYSIKAQHGR